MSDGDRMTRVATAFPNPRGHTLQYLRDGLAAVRRSAGIPDPTDKLSWLPQQQLLEPQAGPPAEVAIAQAVIDGGCETEG